MIKDDFFKNLFNYVFADDLVSYRSLCDLKKSIKTFYILRRGDALYNLEFGKIFSDFRYFFKDLDIDEYVLNFVFDILFKYWFVFDYLTTFIDFLNDFYNAWGLSAHAKEA